MSDVLNDWRADAPSWASTSLRRISEWIAAAPDGARVREVLHVGEGSELVPYLTADDDGFYRPATGVEKGRLNLVQVYRWRSGPASGL